MSTLIDYDEVKNMLLPLNTDDTIASAHGILCGVACVKPDLSLEDWLTEVLSDADLNNLNKKATQDQLAQIYEHTLAQLNDAVLNFQLLIAGENCLLSEQADSLIQWCQGFLVGLGLGKINTSDKDILAMIKDFSEIAKLDINVFDNEQNAQDLSDIIEFVRMGTLLIQETLQPSKQDYISPKILH